MSNRTFDRNARDGGLQLEVARLIEKGETGLVSRGDRTSLLARLRVVNVLLTDFDGPIHPGSHWLDLTRRLPAALQVEAERDFDAYRRFRRETRDLDKIALSGPLSDAHLAAYEAGWMARDVARYARGGLTHEDVEHVIEHTQPRDGARELLALFPRGAVISMGLEEVISGVLFRLLGESAHRYWVGGSQLSYDLSSRIQTLEQGAFPASLKGDLRGWYLRHIAVTEERRVLALGDTVSDLPIMNKEEGVNVFIFPPPSPNDNAQTYRKEHLDAVVERADVVIVGSSLLPLVELIESAKTVYG